MDLLTPTQLLLLVLALFVAVHLTVYCSSTLQVRGQLPAAIAAKSPQVHGEAAVLMSRHASGHSGNSRLHLNAEGLQHLIISWQTSSKHYNHANHSLCLLATLHHC